jgi:hypothetical protein
MTTKRFEILGFDHASNFLLDPAPDSPEKTAKHRVGPAPDPNCDHCMNPGLGWNDARCESCAYDLGWTDGMCK